jgi:hypothetical protein
MLVEKYKDSNCKDKNILTVIDKAIGSSIELHPGIHKICSHWEA